MRATTGSKMLASAVLAALASGGAQAVITPINLNDMFNSGTVAVAADGSSATFVEDSSTSVVFLSNIPGLGDPLLISGGASTSLQFDFAFDKGGGGNDDQFHFALVDAGTGDVIPGFEIFAIDDLTAGAVVALSSLSGALGFQFELVSNPTDVGFDSALTISNVRYITPDDPGPGPTPVPEPSPLALLALGLLGLGMRMMKRIGARVGLSPASR